jgi:hypothetical protein
LKHLEKKISENKTIFNALRFDPAMLATAAQKVVIRSSHITHKVNATIKQAQANKLSTELLRGDTIYKIFDFVVQVLVALNLYLEILLTYFKWNCYTFTNLLNHAKHFYSCVTGPSGQNSTTFSTCAYPNL